ncbi:MAG: site-specific DNA-methyltransferase [Patescibacteria group bacterium]|nr:site-specific DNA-methyltransferase [Patescibacteria group bacterium]
MKIEQIKIKDIRFSEYNPRKITDTELTKLCESIRMFGFVNPVVVNTHTCEKCADRNLVLIGGHQRVKAAESEGMDEVPTVKVDLHLEQEKILNLSLNRIGGAWDADKLADLILDIRGSSILPMSGFNEDEISRILDSRLIDDTDYGNEETIPEDHDSQIGEVYDLGVHRLVCGDSTDPKTFDLLLGDEKADMVWTDPPYNVAYESRGKRLREENKSTIKNNDLPPEQFQELIDKSFFNMLQCAKSGAVFYICSGWSSYPVFFEQLKKHGFKLSGTIVWVKNIASKGWGDYDYKHEWIVRARKKEEKEKVKGVSIIYGWKEGSAHKFFGSRDEFDVWEMPRKAVMQYLHPTEKPDWLPMRAIRNSSKRGDIILDPYTGSGSVMLAAEKTGRRAYMIEYDPRFCDVIRRRYETILRKNQEIKGRPQNNQ